jgi:hypothetical protein
MRTPRASRSKSSEFSLYLECSLTVCSCFARLFPSSQTNFQGAAGGVSSAASAAASAVSGAVASATNAAGSAISSGKPSPSLT